MKKYWFKARRFGWGWRPCSFEGWFITITYIILFILLAFWLGEDESRITQFYGLLVFLILSLLIICYKTGEKPKWRWGK